MSIVQIYVHVASVNISWPEQDTWSKQRTKQWGRIPTRHEVKARHVTKSSINEARKDMYP